MRALALAGVALGCLIGVSPALAQDANDPAAAEPDNPVLNRDARRSFGLDTNRKGLPALRGSRSGGGAPAFGASPATTGESTEGEAGVGLSGGGEGVSRLPRFRTSGGQSISSLSGTTAQTTPRLLRLRAAPPRRSRLPTRDIVRQPMQGYVQDLRLSPIIQQPVSGVPLPNGGAPTVPPIARGVPLLGLLNPNGLTPASAFSRLPDDPADPAYAPLGYRIGTFTVLPSFTQWVGYDTNPDQTIKSAARASPALRSEGEIAYRSDWSSSSLTGAFRGGYSAYPDNEGASRPNGSGATQLRIDVNRDTKLDLESHFVVDTQRLGNPNIGGVTASGRPVFAVYGGSAAVSETFNRLELTLRGGIDRQVFEDVQLSDGSKLVQSDRDANQYTLRLRASYEITPSITPFVEPILDKRVYDTPIDQAGLRRDSDGIGFTAGARFLISNTLSGEISAGMQHREYVDRSLRPITAPLLNTALIWAASPLTTVRFTQTTGVIETSVPGSSGAFTDIAALEIQHDLLRNFSITIGGGYLSNNYEGIRIKETGYSALVRADYRFNRWLTLRGSYIYQTLASTAQNGSYDDHIFLMGLRVNP